MNENENISRTERKKFWLKLDKDYLKSPQMKVIEGMPNGKDYIIFYLKLMLESVETVGHLRFTSLVAYNNEMLASITNTNVDIVRSAIKIFCQLGMMKVFDDGTIFMPEVPNMTGKESESAERVRRFRERQKQELLQCNGDVTKCNDNIDIEYKEEIKEEIDIDNRVDNRTKKFQKPTLEEVHAYCFERKNKINAQKFIDYYESNGWMVGKNKMRDWKAAIRTWENNDSNYSNKSAKNNEILPEWFGKAATANISSKQEQDEMNSILREIAT